MNHKDTAANDRHKQLTGSEKTNLRDIRAFILLFLVLTLRISYFGFEYYCQLDDYIHFREYPPGTDFIAFCIEHGYFASRPFAILSDFWIWGQLPSYISALVVVFMYAASGVLFLRLFRRLFSTGWFFVLVYTLLPLGFEGTYWLAASTRIVPPLFFSALTLLSLDSFCQTKKKGYLLAYMLCSLASFVMYEQLLVLSLAMSLMLMLLLLIQGQRHGLWGLLVFVPVAVYIGFTGYFSSPDAGVGSRMNVVLPTSPEYFSSFLPSLLTQMYDAFVEGGIMTLCKGFVRGAELIVSEGVWSAAFLLVLIPLIFRMNQQFAAGEKGSLFHFAPVFGFLAALAPLTPFFIIANPWFSLRNTAASFLGLALMADYFLRLIFRKRTSVICAVFACVCMIASVSELYDYRMTALHNGKVARTIIQADEEYDLKGAVGILGLDESYLTDQNYEYHDHVLGSHGSDWALEGLLRYYLGTTIDYDPCPLSLDGEYYSVAWNRSIKDVTRFDSLLLYDHEGGTIEPLRLDSSQGEHLMYDEAGNLRVRIWEDDSGAVYSEVYDK